MEQGSITLDVQQRKRNGNSVMLDFRVIDTGIGIPPNTLDLIFQNFKQVSADIKVKYGGTGLGLAITRKIVELQGGTIKVDSEQGQGSVFSFCLPYDLAGSREAEQKTDAVDTPLQLDADKEVLVVEDNFMNQKYVSTLFKKWNIRFTIANNGREGVQLARERAFDLILMDIQMPVMDGYQATEAIRTSENLNQNTPIVALTASGIIANKERGMALGMNDYLTKPFKPDLMHKVLYTYLSNPNKHKDLAMEQQANFTFDPALDFDYLLEMYEMDLEYAYEMFDLFVHHSAQEFPQIGTLIQKQDREAAKKLSHKLKPSFPMVGLPALGQKMADLEQSLAVEGNIAQAQTLYAEAVEMWKKYEPIIQKDYQRLQKVVSPNGTTA
ncbi:MAG: response regulator [Bacteroidota bacterium]